MLSEPSIKVITILHPMLAKP